ncbi:MAG TPA: hypothetical protein HPQ00_10285 [Magnetococcales bacterium]|nr:hypothetical protein [Magnetococcales bacterium]
MTPSIRSSRKINALTVFLMLLLYVAVHGSLRLLLAIVIVLTICHILYHLITGCWLGSTPANPEKT